MGESVVPLSDDVAWGRVNVMLYNVYKVLAVWASPLYHFLMT